PHDLVRTHEEVYKKQFKGKNFNDDEWIKIMLEFPALIKRPIIEREHGAVWGETVENIEQFLSFKTK
ncbi:MAG: ArsC/Spx/MgsR family protein, partial [Bacteroidota bacterium]